MIKNPLSLLSREHIAKSIKYLTWLGALAILWVMFEYMFIGSSRSIPIIKSIKIHVDEFKQHDVVMVQHQQVPFVLVHRTAQQIKQLKETYQGDNALRSLSDEYFIALAIGTNFGCIVAKYQQNLLKESCSQAVYDFTGRSLSKNDKPLIVPPMTFNSTNKFFNLTLK